MQIDPEYLTTRQAAEFIGMSAKWLEAARLRGEGPPHSKLPKAVRYSRSDLVEWMRERRVVPGAVDPAKPESAATKGGTFRRGFADA